MNNLTIDSPIDAAILEKVLIGGDLRSLPPKDRLQYYDIVCKSLGLNPVTRPFEYIEIKGKLSFYARKEATEQLRKIHAVSIIKLEKEVIDSVYVVTAYAYVQSGNGRKDISTGAVVIGGLKGEELSNAYMRAETKAKRRVTLSLCGLGFIDESEIEGIKGARILTEKDLMAETPTSYLEQQADAPMLSEDINSLSLAPEHMYTEPADVKLHGPSPKRFELDLKDVLDDISCAKTKDELKDVLVAASKSNLKDDIDSSLAISQAKEKWRIEHGY